jgi:AcrR family transcriptional regulator
MRQAARAAHLSLGGLYHYFPTKRDLVLHALKPEALDRVCAEFSAEYGHVKRTDPMRYLLADVDYMSRQCFFIRPAFHAALELGEDAWHHIEAGIDGRLKSCATPLRQVLPGCTDEEIRSLGRSLRRTFFSALIDRTVTPEEMRSELLSHSGLACAGPQVVEPPRASTDRSTAATTPVHREKPDQDSVEPTPLMPSPRNRPFRATNSAGYLVVTEHPPDSVPVRV